MWIWIKIYNKNNTSYVWQIAQYYNGEIINHIQLSDNYRLV